MSRFGFGFGFFKSGLGGGPVDPADDFLFRYKLDGTDASLVRVGGDDFRIGPECDEAISSGFDGATQYYTADADLGLINSIGTQDFSISLWIKSTETVFANIYTMTGGGNDNTSFRVSTLSGGLVAFRTNNMNFSTTSQILDGKWHHVCFTVKQGGGVISAYVDGALDDSYATPAYNINGQSAIRIGATPASSPQFNGFLDGLRVYDRELTPTEVTGLSNYRCDWNPSLIATRGWWDFSDISPSNITEASGLVSAVADKSGNGYSMIQSSGSRQPTTGINPLNGVNTISTLTDQQFLTNGDITTSGGNISILMIYKANPPFTNTRDSILSWGNTGFELRADDINDFNGRYNGNGVGGSFNFSPTPNNGPSVLSGILELNVGVQFFIDGVSRGVATYTSALTDGANVRISGARVLGDCAVADYGEVVFADTVNPNIVKKLEGYGAWKWGLVSNLDAGHPFKNEPPRR